ncbi:MAG: glycosyltransferase [archaeon]
MKILVVSKYFLPFFGGIESVVYYNAKYLAKKGHDVVVIASEHKKGLPKTETIDGIGVVRVPTLFKFSAAPINPAVFFEVMKRDFDICNIHEPNPFNNFLACAACFLKKKPFVVTYHSDIIGRGGILKPFFWLYKNFTQRIIFARAKMIMPTSPQYVRISDTLPSVDRKKITVIPNGVDLAKFRHLKKKRRKNEVLFIGRLIYYKGLDVLIKAMKEVVERVPDAKLKIAGTGELEAELKALAKQLKLEKNIKFLGRVSDKELERLLNESAVFVLPSVHRSEAFGIVILEAMSAGCPVITTDISGTVYAAGDAGIIVKNKNVGDLADAIIRVLKDEKLQKRMSKLGLKQAKRFQWKNIAEMTEQVYKKVLRI